MSVLRDFALPDLGEGLTESELVSWHVAVGQTVELNQIIADVETAKAMVELPSPYAGVISQLYVEPGATVAVGEPLVAFEVPGEATNVEVSPQPATEGQAGSAQPGIASEQQADIPLPNLVGYGAMAERTGHPQRRRHTVPASESVSALQPAQTGEFSVRSVSTPPVRKRAHDLGIDLASVRGTGSHGIVTRDDLERFVTESGVEPEPRAGQDAVTEPTSARGAREKRIPVNGVRKLTAEAMVESAFTAPHASASLTVDVTPTLELLDRLRQDRVFDGLRLTPLTAIAKAVCIAVARTPSVNTHWDGDAMEIVQFGYVNLGIAVATPRGLLVPSIKDADHKTLAELSAAMTELVDVARQGRASPAQLTGGTFTISNVGVFGVDSGVPIINPGEAAILAVGAVRRQPWEFNGEVALRSVVTLSLSFDHRLVDGEDGSRFLTDVGRILADPASVLALI